MTPNFIRLDTCESQFFRDVIPSHALARHCPLDNGHHTVAFDNSRAPSLGTLTQLPVELQLQVILQLDVASLLVWMRVNKRAMAFVWGLFEWHQVISPPDALRMAIGFNTHHTFTLTNLMSALHEDECANCTSSAKYTDLSSSHLFRLWGSCFRATKPAKQAVSDAVWKEWERLKSSQNNSFAKLRNDYSRGLISKDVYSQKLEKLDTATQKEYGKVRERRGAGVVSVLMEEAVGCVKDWAS